MTEARPRPSKVCNERCTCAIGAIVALTLAAGCGGSMQGDLSRVETLTNHRLPRALLEEVDPLTDAAVRDTLADPLTADAAVRVALANNRALRGALRDLGVERGMLLQAGLLPNPAVEIDLRHQEDRTQPLQVELYVEYAITEALLTPLRVEAARHDLEAARYRAAGQVLETAYEVRVAFVDVQAAEARLGIALQSLEAQAAARDASVMLFEAGNVPELDAATQIAAYEETRAETALFELDRASARERLSRLLGVHGRDAQWSLTQTFAAPPEGEEIPEDLEARAIDASLELAEMRSRLRAIAGRIGLTRTAGWLPNITVDAHAEQDGNSWEIGGGAHVTLPLFDRREGETAAHEARFDALRERYVGAAIDTRSAARDARNHLASARLRATQYDSVIVPARQRVFEQTLLQYNAMQVGVFELLTALRQRLRSELDGVTARRDQWVARAAMEALLRGRRVGMATHGGAAPDAMDAGATGAEGGH